MRRCYDAAKPSGKPPPWWVCGFYPLGMTPTPWSDTQIRADPARFGLPIVPYIGQDIATEGGLYGADLATWLEARKIPKGVTVCVDTEAYVYHPFLLAMDAKIHNAGYLLMNYGSVRFVVNNPLLSGGRWTADWTDTPHLDNVPGEKGTQYANAHMLGTDYDASVFEDAVPFWEKRPVTPPAPVAWEDLCLEYVDQAMHNLAKTEQLLATHKPKA